MCRVSNILLAAIVLLSAACGSPQPYVSGQSGVGGRVDFRLASLDGGSLGTDDFAGQVVLFDFWATWCSPCHVQARILATLHEEFAARDVAFVAVSLGEPESTVRAFTDQRPFPYPVLVDPHDIVSNQLGIYVLPTIMVLGRDGEVVYLREGVSSAKRLREVLETALDSRQTASL